MILSNKEIQALSNSIISNFDPCVIYLFGSYASGNTTKQSDLDICIIFPKINTRKIDLMRQVRHEIQKVISISSDILVYEKAEFTQRAKLKNTFEYYLQTYGKQLYAA